MMHANPRIFGLDAMRAAAISMVVIGHLAWLFPGLPAAVGMILSLLAFFGVEVFFVLSGFLIGRILISEFTREEFGWPRMRNFIRRRWLRTLPAYFLVLLLNVALAFWASQDLQGSWRYFFFVQNLAWPMPLFFPESWSLSVEEVAYILLPMALLFFAGAVSKRLNRFVAIVSLLIFISIAAKLIYHFSGPSASMQQWNLALKAVVLFRLDAIFIGVMAAWISLKYESFWRRMRYGFAAIGLAGVAFFTAGVGALGLFIERVPMFWDVFYLPGLSLVFALFLPLADSVRSRPRFFGWVSTLAAISYAMYLLHYSLILQLFNHWLPQNAGFKLRMATAVLYLLIVVLASWILYRFFEKPILTWRDKSSKKVNLESFQPIAPPNKSA